MEIKQKQKEGEVSAELRVSVQAPVLTASQKILDTWIKTTDPTLMTDSEEARNARAPENSSASNKQKPRQLLFNTRSSIPTSHGSRLKV